MISELIQSTLFFLLHTLSLTNIFFSLLDNKIKCTVALFSSATAFFKMKITVAIYYLLQIDHLEHKYNTFTQLKPNMSLLNFR